jgi:hypothetical protein
MNLPQNELARSGVIGLSGGRAGGACLRRGEGLQVTNDSGAFVRLWNMEVHVVVLD